MHKFITLPNGDSIRSDTIYAVRLGDAAAPTFPGGSPMVPRVIVDFIGGGVHGNCTICFCETNEERDALAASIREQLA